MLSLTEFQKLNSLVVTYKDLDTLPELAEYTTSIGEAIINPTGQSFADLMKDGVPKPMSQQDQLSLVTQRVVNERRADLNNVMLGESDKDDFETSLSHVIGEAFKILGADDSFDREAFLDFTKRYGYHAQKIPGTSELEALIFKDLMTDLRDFYLFVFSETVRRHKGSSLIGEAVRITKFPLDIVKFTKLKMKLALLSKLSL